MVLASLKLECILTSSLYSFQNAVAMLTIVIGRVVIRNANDIVKSMTVNLVLPSCDGRRCW